MDNDFNYLDLLGIGYNKDNLYHIIDRFLNSELTDKLKAAILANQYYESGFKEDAVNGSFYGINLWNKSQRQHYGDNLDSLIDYLLLEMTPDRGRWPQKERKETWNGWNPKYYKIWTNSDTSVPDLAKAFSLGYERHTLDENDPNIKLRTKLAEQIYKSLIERNSRKNNIFKNYLRWSSNIISRSKKIMNTKKYFIGGTLIPIYRRGSEFGTAFALARKRGDKTFVFKGTTYTTDLAENKQSSRKSTSNKNWIGDYSIKKLNVDFFTFADLQIKKAKEIGETQRKSKLYNAAGPDSLREAIKARLRRLKEAGYYNGRIDGIWKDKSKAAQAAYDRDHYKKNVDVKENSNSSEIKFDDLSNKDKKQFAEWLFSEGGKDNSTRGKLANTLAGALNWSKNAFGTYGSFVSHLPYMELAKFALGVDDNGFSSTEGMKKLIAALHLYDNRDINLNNDTIVHVLGYGPDGKYKWQQLNGKKDTNDVNRTLYDRASTEPGNYNLGRFTLKETPDKMFIDDDYYNFNPEGTLVARNIVLSGNADMYNRLRAWTGESGLNKDIPVNLEIPKEQLDLWTKEWLKDKNNVINTVSPENGSMRNRIKTFLGF